MKIISSLIYSKNKFFSFFHYFVYLFHMHFSLVTGRYGHVSNKRRILRCGTYYDLNVNGASLIWDPAFIRRSTVFNFLRFVNARCKEKEILCCFQMNWIERRFIVEHTMSYNSLKLDQKNSRNGLVFG